MARYEDLLEEDFNRQIEFNNIKIYHEQGYKGQGVTIVNVEGSGDHRKMTSKVIKDYAPECNLLEGYFSAKLTNGKIEYYNIVFPNEVINIEEAIDKYNIKIFTRSKSGATPKAVLDYYKDLQKRKGVIFFNSAGNEPADGITGVWSKYDTAIAVGAVSINQRGEIKKERYSALGEELDFVSFMARGVGTSASSPNLAAQVALLLQKYGDFTQAECVEILKSISLKLGAKNEYGHGLPILPLTDRLEILEKLRGDNMDFKDVENDRWSKPAIDRCVDEGLLIGFEDGTFRPTENVTREQLAQVLVRLLER